VMRLKVEQAGQGLHPNEVVVAVQTSHGQEHLVVSKRSIEHKQSRLDGLSEGGKATSSWSCHARRKLEAWRVWVPEDQIDEHEERMRA
jgi:hypothetical protein